MQTVEIEKACFSRWKACLFELERYAFRVEKHTFSEVPVYRPSRWLTAASI